MASSAEVIGDKKYIGEHTDRKSDNQTYFLIHCSVNQDDFKHDDFNPKPSYQTNLFEC